MGEQKPVILKAERLVKSYEQDEAAPAEILHGIDLELRAGEIVAILGPSGAGKSTLLHVLGLMEPPSGGELFVGGKASSSLTTAMRAQLRNQFIGFLFQFHYLLPELTVLENVMVPPLIRGAHPSDAEEVARRLLDRIGLADHLQKKPAVLSGGEQQRVSLARALANGPSVLLADEPTGNLDKENGEKVLSLLWQQVQERGAGALIVTHQEDIAQRADRWIRLRDGRVESVS
jgi:lipoprotein-releasing system ATP-binding protein